MTEWQPIETAPDNTDEVLALNCSKRISVELGTYLNRMLQISGDDDDECFYTHWMPLPKLPGDRND